MYLNNIIREYERILKDPSKLSVDTYHFKDISQESQQAKALEIIKYAIEYIMHYSPSEALRYVNTTVFDYLKLSSLLKYIRIPTGLDEKDQIVYILSLCYPKKIFFDQKITLRKFMRI